MTAALAARPSRVDGRDDPSSDDRQAVCLTDDEVGFAGRGVLVDFQDESPALLPVGEPRRRRSSDDLRTIDADEP
jgi:hypothetical protein